MDTICAVVVTFRPDVQHLRELVSRLRPQVGKIIVVDNSPLGDDSTVRALEPWSRDCSLTRIETGSNLGIAAGLNIGIASAIKNGFPLILLSDQDSRPAFDMVRRLVNVAREIEADGSAVACICPSFVDLVTRQEVPFQTHRQGDFFYSKCFAKDATPWTEIIVGITSGSLIPASAFDSVGYMNESLFIDYVDTEWCLRARSAGLVLAGVGEAVLEHRLGDGSFDVWYWRWRRFNDCDPQRMYYRMRNFIYLCRQRYVPVAWKLRSGWNWIGNVYAYLVFSPNGRRHARWMAKGFVDGIRGRLGAL